MPKVFYIVVVDDDAESVKKASSSVRYTRSLLQSTLQLIGCKARHAFKISQRVFEIMRDKNIGRSISKYVQLTQYDAKVYPEREGECHAYSCVDKEGYTFSVEEERRKSKPFELYKKRTTVVVERENFLNVVCQALQEYKYMGPDQRADLVVACRIRERKDSITVLLCGTSGCGKSTLSALLGSRLGITTVVSTDSIRHMMRSFVDEEQNPLLWASTYHAGECLDPVAVAEAKAKKRAKKSVGISQDKNASNSTTGKSEGNSTSAELISSKQMAIEGFKAQSEMVIDSLDRLITAWEERKESVVVEGVHLSLNFVMGLMKKHPSIIPFMIYISNEEKHLERFAVRAKYMTLDPAKNKYVKYIKNIRTIQEYLCRRADKHLVPKINNTNVDRSVAAIHATVFSCLRRREMGDHLYDPVTNTVSVIDEEYSNQCAANSLTSKGMFQLIQRLGSSRHLMALLNDDGSVKKAWPVESIDHNGKPIVGQPWRKGIGTPMYGPLQIGKAEPINLQFGHFGISAWPSDTGGTSRTSSVDGGELTDNGSRYFSSTCSSPRFFDGPAKELKEELSVHGSDEEVEEQLEFDSDDEDLSDGPQHMHEELEGSVDEESTKSDEEYDDLAMLDIHDGYMTDDDEALCYAMDSPGMSCVPKHEPDGHGMKHPKKLELFRRSKSESLSGTPTNSTGNSPRDKSERRTPRSGNSRFRKRSQSMNQH